MRPDTSLPVFVGRLRRRAAVQVVAQAVTFAGIGAALMVVGLRLTTGPRGTGAAGVAASALALAAFCAWLAISRQQWSANVVVSRAESAVPGFRNQLVTAIELAGDPTRASARIADLVERRAAAVAETADVRRIVPLARPLAIGGAGMAAFTGSILLALSPLPAGEIGRAVAGLTAVPTTPAAHIDRIDVRSIPPAYAGGTASDHRDPTRLELLAGTRLEVRIHGGGARFDARVADEPIAMTSETGGAGLATFTATTAGALVVSAADTTGTVRERRVIALVVSDDAAPRIVFEKPAADLVLADPEQSIDFAARAADDLALASLTLHYTKVSGSGEQYEFDEGTIPWTIVRTAPGEWRATTTRPPSAFGVREGDLLVYHARATDGRPGREPAVSDAFVIEIGKPQLAIAGGFAIPPDEERSAISLSALIRKTEKLQAQRGALSADAFSEQAAGLAIEQRMVRTETLFMMGSHGHVEDEEVEAAHSHEIQEGRLENRGHAELLTAIRLMTRAEQRLLANDTSAALVAQRGALASLQRALSRQRYFLRTVPVRSQIDPSRRASGDLSAARSWTPAPPRPDTSRAERAQALLTEAEALAEPAGGADAAALAGFAARLLALDPASNAVQRAGLALTRADAGAARADAWRNVVRLLDAVASTPVATPGGPAGGGGSLAGAYVDALREPASVPRSATRPGGGERRRP